MLRMAVLHGASAPAMIKEAPTETSVISTEGKFITPEHSQRPNRHLTVRETRGMTAPLWCICVIITDDVSLNCHRRSQQ